MQDITEVFTIVAKVFIYCGATMFIVCFLMGAYTLYQIFSTTLYTIKVAKKWHDYNNLSQEAKIELIKSSKFKE